MTFWGFTDKYSWVDAFFGADDPLLYDDALAPKPARTGVLNGLDGIAGPGLDLGLGTNCGTTLGTAAWCAPFEPTDLGRDYTAVTSGSVAPSTTRFYKGARSLRATVAGGSNGQSVVGRRALAPRTSGELWIRTYVYVPTGTATQGLTLLAMGEADPPFHGVSAGISGGKVQLGFTTANQFPVSNVTFPTGAWTCVELRVAISNTAGAATVYVNGTAVQSVAAIDTLPVGGISNANLGILYVAPGSPTIEAWFDEAAFGTQRLPCD